MNEQIKVEKDEDEQTLIPTIWRHTLASIVGALQKGDLQIANGIAGVRPVSESTAKRIFDNILAYGARLTVLPEETWETSACQWMDGYWDVLVDLFTIEEENSDLVLALRVYEKNNGYEFEVNSVHVP